MSEKTEYPLIPLRGITFLPSMVVHFDLDRKKSVRALDEAVKGDQMLFLVAQEDPSIEDPEEEDLYQTGCIAKVRSMSRMQDGKVRLLVEVLRKGILKDVSEKDGYLCGEIEEAVPDPSDSNRNPDTDEAMRRALLELFERYCRANQKLPQDLPEKMRRLKTMPELVDAVAVSLPLSFELKQKVLEAGNLDERFALVIQLVGRETEILGVKNSIQADLKTQLDKNQRDYILREQIKVIKKQLGEDPLTEDAARYRKQLKGLVCSDEVRSGIEHEITRLESLGMNSAEASVSRGYIETLLALPWDKKSEDNNSLKNARRVLDEDHYGLETVKERILEYLSVRALTKRGESPILCLVGPPGTGKTSIARSVARALGRKYVRISLGGVHDEAEIRGHRRTYIGAMPGRIAAGLKTAEVKNPLMLLDEIDKVSSDIHGDCESALLEVLDSEQNAHFSDHYVEMPLDLSEVLFIATANDLSTIAKPLRDRMEIIEIGSYTENEKFHIAKEHLLPKTLAANGLTAGDLSISDGALKKMISLYTREAGVRSLERLIGKASRRAAEEILLKIEDGELPARAVMTDADTKASKGQIDDGDGVAVGFAPGVSEERKQAVYAELKRQEGSLKEEVALKSGVTAEGSAVEKRSDGEAAVGESGGKAAGGKAGAKVTGGKSGGRGSKKGAIVRIRSSNLVQYLGPVKFPEKHEKKRDEVGVVNGLAWTAVGGVTLRIEVNTMPGKGALLLTGQMGDVMKESAQAGISYIRSIAEKHGIDADYFSKTDIHIHIPEGAVPKDGPSAGITMATAIFSAVTGKKVRGCVAMTGEITLRGRVLPIGGLKEKLLAANSAGMTTVLIPEDNRSDFEEISSSPEGSEIIGAMTIKCVSSMEQVLEHAIVK